MESLDGRVAVVTGGASGIGLAIAGALAAAGCRVLLTDLDGDAVTAAADGLGPDADVATLALDVRDQDAVEAAGRHAVERFGGLHVAVNNAGIVNGGRSWELSLDEWHRVVDVNLWGVVHGVRAFVPRILETGEGGHVVNVSSMAAVMPLAGLGPYVVAKHGVLGLSDVLRAELAGAGEPVGVSVVMPGRVRTGMNPIGVIEPSVVAANVLDGIRRDRPYVYTDHEGTRIVEERLGAILAARADVLPSVDG